jgi:hypothetical protein
MDPFFEKHSGELMILFLSVLLLGSLLLLVPQLLRSHQHALELQHTEHMLALEKGQPLPLRDERSLAAGRTASLVPIIVICAAATVTCFLAAYKSDSFFAVALATWSVGGVVSLAAITGGVSLMGRLAQLQTGEDEEEPAPEAAPPDK